MKSLLLFLFILIAQFNALSQSNYKNFDKIELNNINGSVDIQLGKAFSVDIKGLNNNDSSVTVKLENEYKLVISLKKGLGWEVMKNINLKIKITMPEISKLFNNSNADISISNFLGRYLGIENNGNGNVYVSGTIVDVLDIANNGNGDCKTKEIVAKKVNITKTGNGDVVIKTNNAFEVKMSGNGDVVNYGKGIANILKQSGNGKVIYR